MSCARSELVKRIAAEIVRRRVKDKEGANKIKVEVTRALSVDPVPSDTEVIGALLEMGHRELAEALRKRPVKTRSGVSVITVVLPLFLCPHGRCIYCPGGGSTGISQSYTGREAWVAFAASIGYDVRRQVEAQTSRLSSMGHQVDKVELIFIGGTFTAAPEEFQRNAIKEALDGLHGPCSSLEEALERAELAVPRVSGITVETKPDWAKGSICDELLRMGVTRVEIGVQALDDEVYKVVKRGHTVQDVTEATADLKDRAFKVTYHVMPGLPCSTPQRDREWFRQLFEDQRFRPDALKIYPTMVLPHTPLQKMYERGEYEPYDLEEMVELLVDWLSIVPPYVRVNRIRREIPNDAVTAGAWPGNLRQIVERRMRSKGIRCRCVRCREVGNPEAWRGVDPSDVSFEVRELRYAASYGTDVFISFEDPKHGLLAGLLRLRLPERYPNELTEDAALVRELHVYGPVVPVGARDRTYWQHRGVGAELMRRAEEIAESEGRKRVIVISAVGVREYYYRLGYRRKGPYVSKDLQ
ncbi:MAG: tRNA uridine(34) 5-carboxymethylaminomethyl modification radical SAM/GNAT enzyme Elp3 [Thaumarchaeota archaeon]|nr:tRNA uridine(34) 5-carboxymethylaminomethyl modification radical SAM/GNAT enzyme Elp3 [Candidatus Calditenuaceae archaeon]MDW8186492.1 tRNA uridine(34) 5-carboxymethylaminomethyl modification radical SAM/GNAT enzyme Elp3 [Nitrososphaerota archaeon]